MKTERNQTEKNKSEMFNGYLVTKSNKLINANYDLSLNELKIMLILASRIQPNENTFNQYTFKASELAELLQITPEAMYKELPKITKNLMSKQLEIESEDGRDLLQVNLLSAALYRKGRGTVILEFSSMLAPYLLELKHNFTRYRLENILLLNSKYSIRMYELFKSHFKPKEPFFITVSDLRKQLRLTQKSYEAYSIVKTKVIDVAVKEISEMTDLKVEWEAERVGRKVENLYFTITDKTPDEITKKQRKLKGKRSEATPTLTVSPSEPQSDSAPTVSKAKKESKEPFVDYLQVIVKKKTKKHLSKKDARFIASLVKEDMTIFGPVLPYLNEKIENPTGFIRDFITNNEAYQKPKRAIRQELLSNVSYPSQPELSEAEKQARIKRMEELRDTLLMGNHSAQLSMPI